MFFFEDFMEAIEPLPTYILDDLAEIRRLDDEVQRIQHSLESRIKGFFESCKCSRLSEKEKEMEYENILKEYDRAADYSRKKIEIADRIRDLYDKVDKKLAGELNKFRLELEADNVGITAKIEHRVDTILGIKKKRFLSKHHPGRLYNASRNPQRRHPFSYDQDKQFFVHKKRVYALSGLTNTRTPSLQNANGAPFVSEDSAASLVSDGANRLLASDSLQQISGTASLASMDQNLPDSEFGPFSTDIVEDFLDDDEDSNLIHFDVSRRSRTVGTPQRTSGLPTEHNRLHRERYSPFVNTLDTENIGCSGVNTGNPIISDHPSIDDMLVNPSSPTVKSSESPHWVSGIGDKTRRVGTHSRRPSQISVTGGADSTANVGPYINPSSSTGDLQQVTPHRYTLSQSPARPLKDTHAQENETSNASGNNADDRTYCFCKDVSYGEMIACDAPNCPIEWFHYSCVNLTVAPKGQWYCPMCSGVGTRFSGASSATRKRITRR